MAPQYRGVTLRLIALSAVNFAGSETFAGWTTAYLKERHYGGHLLGDVVAAQGLGGLLGVIAWGFLADRYGRRFNALGFALTPITIVAFMLTAGYSGNAAIGAMFAYSMVQNASMIWGPMFAELYPIEIRSTAASLFHYGRIVSFAAPTLVAAAADHYGLAPAMSAGVVVYALGAAIWWSLPESLAPQKAARA
jgi:MFS family permease